MTAGVTAGDRFRGWSDIQANAARAAGGLAALGVGEDDSVALMLRNDFATFEVNMAAASLGAYAVPINWHFTAEEAGYILTDCRARVLVAHADFLAQIADGIPAGVTVLVVPTPVEIGDAYIDRHRVSHMHIVPTMFVRLLRVPEEVRRTHDLSSLRFVSHGAAPCSPAVKRQMIEWWGPVINEYYGATETGIVVWHDAEAALRKPGTVGRVVEGATLRIVDEQGRDVRQGDVGEIYLRGPHLSDFTYHNDDAKRREVALNDLVTVGDIGYLDPDGYLFLCDRKRDMIISGGVNIYPAEIESVLIQMPGVRDCAVFGIPDEEFGERICAFVEPGADVAIDAMTVRAFLAERVARYKVPKIVEFSAALPREDSGKIFKRKLRAPYWEKAGRAI